MGLVRGGCWCGFSGGQGIRLGLRPCMSETVASVVAGHVVPLLQEHLKFDYEDVGDGYFCLHLNLLFPVGKGALQSQQGVPLISRVYNWKVRVS